MLFNEETLSDLKSWSDSFAIVDEKPTEDRLGLKDSQELSQVYRKQGKRLVRR